MNTPNRLPVPTRTGSADPSRARLVLLADGSKAHRRMLSVQLDRAGYRVIEAADGATALQLCRDREPDVILSDWMLAGINGPDLCRAHRTLSRKGYGYFILLSSKTDSADIATGLQAGADDFLVKPVSGAELLARISAAERVLDMQRDLHEANTELHAALDRLSDAQQQMTADLREARKLQQALIVERQRSFGALRVSLLMRPAGLIGGDLVGFQQIDADSVGLHAVDVSGHGVAAALLTARLAAQIESLSRDRRLSPAGVVAALNDLMLDALQTDSYLTMIYGVIDIPSGRLRLVQAGHPHPLLQRAGGRIERVGRGGLPVGVVREAVFEEIEVTLAPGDRLLIVSDGLTDAVSRRGATLGEDGLCDILRMNTPLSGHGLLEAMCWSVSDFSGGERIDDASAVLVEYLPGATIITPARVTPTL